MRFYVLHGNCLDESKPCEGAYKTQVLRKDVRTVDSPDKLMGNAGREWYTIGAGHTVIDGRITRYLLESIWAVHVENLTELMHLAKNDDCTIRSVSLEYESLAHKAIPELIIGEME